MSPARPNWRRHRPGSIRHCPASPYARITAPRDGILISRSVEQGNVVTPANVLMVLAPGGVTQLVLLIDERNLGKMAIGPAGHRLGRCLSGPAFHRHARLYQPGDRHRPRLDGDKARCRFSAGLFAADMTVSVDIEVARRNGVLVVPGESVRDALSDIPWVMVLRGGRAQRQDVTLGLQGNSQTEIKTGLRAGETVIPASSPTKAGARVRATGS